MYYADFNNLLLILKCFFFGFVLLGVDLAFLDTIVIVFFEKEDKWIAKSAS